MSFIKVVTVTYLYARCTAYLRKFLITVPLVFDNRPHRLL